MLRVMPGWPLAFDDAFHLSRPWPKQTFPTDSTGSFESSHESQNAVLDITTSLIMFMCQQPIYLSTIPTPRCTKLGNLCMNLTIFLNENELALVWGGV